MNEVLVGQLSKQNILPAFVLSSHSYHTDKPHYANEIVIRRNSRSLGRCLCPFEKWGLLNLNLIIYLEIQIAKLIFKRGPMD